MQHANAIAAIIAPTTIRAKLEPLAWSLAEVQIAWMFVDDVNICIENGYWMAAVPAFNDLQLDLLGGLVSAHPTTAFLAVVADPLGHQTRRAIQAGAMMALNLLIPGEVVRDAVRMIAAGHLGLSLPVADSLPPSGWAGPAANRPARVAAPGPATSSTELSARAQMAEPQLTAEHCRTVEKAETADPVGAAGPGQSARVTRTQEPTRRSEAGDPKVISWATRGPTGLDLAPLDPEEQSLVEFLRDGLTVMEVAGRCYCSERSLYRRLRALYDKVGVRGRRELISRLPQQRSSAAR